MSSEDKSAQTRKSFVESVRGKAKEWAGAITGNDSLTAEGQLEHRQGKERRAASRLAAEADAETARAQAEAREAELEGATERQQARTQTAEAKAEIRDQQIAARRAADHAVHQDAARRQTAFEAEVQREAERAKADERSQIRSASAEYGDAIDDYNEAVGDAVRTEAQADRLRSRVEGSDPAP